MKNDTDVKRVRMRNNVIREMITTEKNYGGHLESLTRAYMKPIKARCNTKNKMLLNAGCADTVFDGIVPILDLHKMVIGQLEAAWQAFPNVNIGAVFKQIAPYLKLYTVFVNKFDESVNILKRARKNNKLFVPWLQTVQIAEGMDLGSLLITPVQRIPRYDLLLKELIKCTPDTHVDFEDLVGAELQIKEVAELINERKREAEQMAMVKAIASKFDVACNVKMGFEIVQPHRVFLREDKMNRLLPSSKKPIVCRVFLFSDMLLLATLKSRKQRDKDKKHPLLHYAHLMLKDAGVGDVAPGMEKAGSFRFKGSMVLGGLEVASSKLCITCSIPYQLEGDSLVLDAGDVEHKASFAAALEEAIRYSQLTSAEKGNLIMTPR